MAWPLPLFYRPRIRSAIWYIEHGYGEDYALEELQAKQGSTESQAQIEVAEARRAIAFREALESAPSNRSFAATWFGQMRNVWKAGYGQNPTASERSWAYTHPNDTLGLRIKVNGRGAWSGRYVVGSVTINVPWSYTLDDTYNLIREYVQTTEWLTVHLGSEPLQEGSIELSLMGGALLAHQVTTLPTP